MLATTTTIAQVPKELTAWPTEFASIAETTRIAIPRHLGVVIWVATKFAPTRSAYPDAMVTVIAITDRIVTRMVDALLVLTMPTV